MNILKPIKHKITRIRHEIYLLCSEWRQVFISPPYSHKPIEYNEYNHKFLSSVKLTWFQKRRMAVLDSVMDIKINSYLDFGAGNCAMLRFFKKKRGIEHIAASEITNFTKDICANFGIEYKDSLSSSKTQFDLVTAFEVLEHTADPEGQALQLFEKTNKIFAFTVPNTGYWLHRLRLCFGQFPYQWKSQQSEHLRFWTVSDMYKWVEIIFPEYQAKVIPYYHCVYRRFLSRLFCRGIFVVIKKI